MHFKVKQSLISLLPYKTFNIADSYRQNFMTPIEHSKGIFKGEEELLINSLEKQMIYNGCPDPDKGGSSPNMSLKLLSLLHCCIQFPMLFTYGFWLAHCSVVLSVNPLESTEDYSA